MERHDLTPIVEALLFASDQPLTVNALVKAIDDETVDRAAVREVLDILREHYETARRGFRVVRLGNGYQMLTEERYAPWIDNLVTVKRRTRLSRAALETAAVIAYKQPLSRIEIERIRGVDAGGVLATLLERGLIMIKGRDPGPGRPLLYGTTQAFLEYFGLSALSDLPRLDELAALAGIDREAWNERERARFEKVGVDAAEIPEVEDLFSEEDPEGEIPEEDLSAEEDDAAREAAAIEGGAPDASPGPESQMATDSRADEDPPRDMHSSEDVRSSDDVHSSDDMDPSEDMETEDGLRSEHAES